MISLKRKFLSGQIGRSLHVTREEKPDPIGIYVIAY